MSLDAEELEHLVVTFLSNGVPVSVVARSLELDPHLVKRVLAQVHVDRYGTDDMAEYLDELRWDAIDHARKVIANGAPADQTKFAAFVLGKEIALGARRTSEATREATGSLMDALAKMRTGETKDPGERSKFVVTVED